MDDFSQPSYLITNDPQRKSSTVSPGSIGVYDTSILCKECDNFFSPWENHFKNEFYKKFLTFKKWQEDNNSPPFILAEGFSQKKIKLFFLSLLWRASISSHVFYKRVSCGKYEEVLRNMILNEDAGKPDDFAVLSSYYYDHEKKSYSKLKLSPIRHRMEGINFYKFVFLGFEYSIKVDNQKLPSTLSGIELGEHNFWIIIPKAFINSDVHNLALKIAEHVKRTK